MSHAVPVSPTAFKDLLDRLKAVDFTQLATDLKSIYDGLVSILENFGFTFNLAVSHRPTLGQLVTMLDARLTGCDPNDSVSAAKLGDGTFLRLLLEYLPELLKLIELFGGFKPAPA